MKKKRYRFPAQYPNTQWHSLEEASNFKNLDEKVDIFSIGYIFYQLICGAEPWNKLEPGGKMPPKQVISNKVKKGILLHIPPTVFKATDPVLIAICKAMIKCYIFQPNERPSAHTIAADLRLAYHQIIVNQK